MERPTPPLPSVVNLWGDSFRNHINILLPNAFHPIISASLVVSCTERDLQIVSFPVSSTLLAFFCKAFLSSPLSSPPGSYLSLEYYQPWTHEYCTIPCDAQNHTQRESMETSNYTSALLAALRLWTSALTSLFSVSPSVKQIAADLHRLVSFTE